MKKAIEVSSLSKKFFIDEKNYANNSIRDFISNFFKKRKSSKKREYLAINNIGFDIFKGDRVAIIGHNGAGKSTLLKILSGVMYPTSGSIKVYGKMASLLEVGTGFHPELTGRENIYLNGSILGMDYSEIAKNFDEIVDFAGVREFLDTPLKRYSSGMAARLGFAVAAHLNSDILIVDEVLAVGDAAFQRKCLGKMNSISSNENKTILFVSHNINTVLQLCNKGIVLNKGEIQFYGDIAKAAAVYDNIISDSGDGKFKLIKKDKDIEFCQKESGHFVKSGDDLMFKFEVHSNKNFENCFLDFGIYNDMYYPIIHYKSSGQDENFLVKKGINKITVNIPKLSLNNGVYKLVIYMSNSMNEVLLNVKDINIANVTGANIFSGPSSIVSCDCNVNVEN